MNTKGAALALADQISAEYRLPETGWRHDHAIVVLSQGCHSLVLTFRQLTEESRLDRFASAS